MNFYFLALIPLLIGGLLLIVDKHLNWKIWAAGFSMALLTAVIFQYAAVHGMTADVETWSGHITKITHNPAWVEEYEESHTRTVGSGKDSHEETYYTTEHDHHRENWTADRVCGVYADTIEITEQLYLTIRMRWGNNYVQGEKQNCSHFDGTYYGGDYYHYDSYDQKHYTIPVTILKSFSNKIKACPSVFSFTSVPTNIPVYPWPENPNPFQSQRVIGTALKYINVRQWDIMNDQLGASKKVNLIIVGFNSNDEMLGQYQRAKWIGGKKNDLVITVGGPDLLHPAWCYVFGWTDSDVCKEEITSHVMAEGLSSTFIPFIEKSVVEHYQIKQWEQFDYLSVEPATRYYVWFLIILFLTQGTLYGVATYLDMKEKETNRMWAKYDGSAVWTQPNTTPFHHRRF